MADVSKRSQLNLYDPVEQEFKFSSQQGSNDCKFNGPNEWSVNAPVFKLSSGQQVVANVASAILANASAVVTEKSRAEAKEAELKAEIDAEVANRISAVSTEATARQGVQTNLNTESLARTAGDEGLQQQIDQEASSRLSGSTTILWTIRN